LNFSHFAEATATLPRSVGQAVDGYLKHFHYRIQEWKEATGRSCYGQRRSRNDLLQQ